MGKVLMKGNEAIGEAAVQAGCRFFFGYPITPQTELPEYLAKRFPEVDGCFLQAESEVSAINMVYGAASCGARVMTSSSGPGISLKSEGLSNIACAELPCVVVNIVRGGPGLANIAAAQSDYFQATKGGGHGDYHLIVLAPDSVQELYDLTFDAFDIADKYRNPVMILGDGVLGQMMEPVQFRDTMVEKLPEKDWALTGKPKNRGPRITSSLHIIPEDAEQHVKHLFEKYDEAAKNETRFDEYKCDDAEVVLVAFGTSARICKGVVDKARAEGIKAGVFRPITVYPYPSEQLNKLADKANSFLVVEMNAGQMLEDVKLAINGKKPVHFHGRPGGVLPEAADIIELVRELAKGGAR